MGGRRSTFDNVQGDSNVEVTTISDSQDGEAVQPEAATLEANGTAKTAKPKLTVMVPISVPIAMHKLLAEKAAADDNKSVTAWAREQLAKTVEYTLSPFTRTRTRKFATKEDRERAQAERYEKSRALMAALDAGEIDVSVLEKFRAALKAEKEAAEAAKAKALAEAAAVAESTPATAGSTGE